jgi:hypothetical protein
MCDWKRFCPSCKKELSYTTSSHLTLAIKRNGVCKECIKKRTRKYNISSDFVRFCCKCNKKLVYSSRRNLIRAVKRNGLCRKCNGKYTDKSGNVGYNLKACSFIDKLNKEKGWNLQHALNGGEEMISGYFVDGYDKGKNIIFEYDEKYHISKKQRQRDLIRQEHIINSINPLIFLRYDEKENKLYDVISMKSIFI